jgi:hypothetical protein
MSTDEAHGALGAAARRFTERFLSGEPARGEAGLRALAAAVDRFALDGAAEHEDAFLEGAGALFGVIVIEHFRGRARHVERGGVHRLALGAAGFVDPFAVIARLLDGDEAARGVLASELAVIEAELAGTGPVARVGLALQAALAEERPELEVVDRFDQTVVLSDDTEIDMGQVLSATRDLPLGPTPPAVTQAVKKLVSMLPGGSATRVGPELLSLLVPRLVGPSFPSESGVHAMPLAGELRLALTTRHVGRARFVLERELPALGLPHDELLRRALDNLARASRGARVIEDGPLTMLRSGDGLDSARLVLPGLHETFTSRLGEAFLAAVPHRDVLWLARREHEAALRVRAEADFARAPHRISARLYRVERERLSPHE